METPRKKMKKEKKEKKDKKEKKSEKKLKKKRDRDEMEQQSSPAPVAQEVTLALSKIAQPLADEDLSKKVLKLVKKTAKSSGMLKRGVKEVVKALRKGESGVCVIAGDISPIDVISHLPVLCEDANVEYVYVRSKASLGAAAQTKRPTSCVLATTKDGFEYASLHKEVKKAMKAVQVAY